MDTSVLIFTYLLDIFIVYTIFTIYFYVLIKYFINDFENNTCANYFAKHLKFYDNYIKIYKKINNYKQINFEEKLENLINNTPDNISNINYSLTNIIISSSILGLGILTLLYFYIYKKQIIQQVKLSHVLFTIIINILFIIGFECLFIIFVYGNTDLINIANTINYYYNTYNSQIYCHTS
jgi:hypothetical protein